MEQNEKWTEQFDNFYALPENMTPGPQRERAIKSFISTLLQEERGKAYKQGWKDGCNELLEGRFDTRF